MRFRLMSTILAAGFLLAACMPPTMTQSPGSPATELPDVETPSGSPMPIETGAASTPGTGWVEYRDARYGYGIALPCYWNVLPTPAEGMFATMTARSYSEAFFAANSQRGEWTGDTWPQGAYKIDIVAVEGINPALPMEEAIRYVFATPFGGEQEVLSVEEKSFGTHKGYLTTVQGGLQGGETTQSVFFEVSPGTLLSFGFDPAGALDSADIQSVLSSFAAPGEPVTLPSQTPSGPPEGDTTSCE